MVSKKLICFERDIRFFNAFIEAGVRNFPEPAEPKFRHYFYKK